MTKKNFWMGALALGGLWAAVMGFGMLGMSFGCHGQGHDSSASGGGKSAQARASGHGGHGQMGGHDHMGGGHDHMGGGQGQAASGQGSQAAARSGKRPPSIFDSPPPEGTKAYCPVMKKTFFISKSSPKTRYKGKWVYFCCSSCKGKFEANPEAYLKD